MKNISNFYRGDTLEYSFTFFDKDGTPLDLSDKILWFTLKENIEDDDNDAAIQIRVDNHTDPANGITKLTVSPQDTYNLIPDMEYYYDFQLSSIDGTFVKTVLAGKVKVLPDVTRRTG